MKYYHFEIPTGVSFPEKKLLTILSKLTYSRDLSRRFNLGMSENPEIKEVIKKLKKIQEEN